MRCFQYIRQIISLLYRGGVIKTIYYNFTVLPFKHAIKFPIIVFKNVKLTHIRRGHIKFDCTPKFGMVRLGCRILSHSDNRYDRTIWDIMGTLVIKGNTIIGSGCRFVVGRNGVLSLGDNFRVTGLTTILAEKEITFGNDCLLSWEVFIMDTDWHPIKMRDTHRLNPDRAIAVGDNVWIGFRSMVLKGTTIPSGCIVSAGSKLSGDVACNTNTLIGNPLHIEQLRTGIFWSDH